MLERFKFPISPLICVNLLDVGFVVLLRVDFSFPDKPLEFNSLPAKSCYGPHHDGAVFLFSGMVLMDEHTPPPGAYAEGVGRGRC